MNRILIVGPYASEYSIAKVNRNLGINLKKYSNYDVYFYANPKYTDRVANNNDIKRYPFLKDMETTDNLDSDIIIFYNFPKSIFGSYELNKLKGSLKIAYLGWEESVYPQKLVNECNQHLQGIASISVHVRTVFRQSGIKIPIKVINHGLDIVHVNSEKYELKTNKNFKFYHNSSGQYRKGIDILIRSYIDTFKKDDDVVLILKLYPNQSQDKNALKLIEDNINGPEILVINDPDITDAQMKYLAESSQVHVYPTRAEGFGLPIAEGLALGKAVITTGYSGQMDFVNNDNSFILNYSIVDSNSHLNIPGSKVAEPDINELKRLLRYVYENYDSNDVRSKIENAKSIKHELTWEKASKQILKYIEDLKDINLKEKRIGVVSTYNSNCGIAVYSEDLYEKIIYSFSHFSIYSNSDISNQLNIDPLYVKRVWKLSDSDFSGLKENIIKDKLDYIHIQYNTSFYSPHRLSQLIDFAKKNNIKSIVTLHMVNESLNDIKYSLNNIDLLLVHNKSDKDKLIDMGINNAVIIKHGLPIYPDSNIDLIKNKLGLEGREIISTHGLIHDKKGFTKLLNSIKYIKKEIPNILLLMLTAINPDNATSRITYENMRKIIKKDDIEDNVIIIPEFIESSVIIKLLQSSLLIILPYSNINEGASGALKYAIASHRPVLLTDSYIFNDIDLGSKLINNDPETISNKVIELLKNKKDLFEMRNKVEEFIKEYSWEEIAIDYLKLLSKI